MFLIGLRTCLNCGSFFVQQGLLCTYCTQVLLDAQYCGLEETREKSLAAYSFFDWVPQESDALSRLLLGLKGPLQKAAWEYWAKLFWRERLLGLDKPAKITFVPAASSSGKIDHAHVFAQALAKLSGGEFLPTLSKLTKTQQRGRRREQRSQVVVQSRVKFADADDSHLVVLVDDILTTGATAFASYQALGKPVNFEVWTLAKRCLACGVSVDLV